MTIEWTQQEDSDVWTARAGAMAISVYRADNGHWFSIALGLPPLFLGNKDMSLELMQARTADRLRYHLIAALVAMDCEVMCWRRGDKEEAARMLGGRELRELAALAGIADTVRDVAECAPAMTSLAGGPRDLEAEVMASMPGIPQATPAAHAALRERALAWLSSAKPRTNAPAVTAPAPSPTYSESEARDALEQRLLSGEVVTFRMLKTTCPNSSLIDEVIAVLNMSGKIDAVGSCPETGLVRWQKR